MTEMEFPRSTIVAMCGLALEFRPDSVIKHMAEEYPDEMIEAAMGHAGRDMARISPYYEGDMLFNIKHHIKKWGDPLALIELAVRRPELIPFVEEELFRLPSNSWTIEYATRVKKATTEKIQAFLMQRDAADDLVRLHEIRDDTDVGATALSLLLWNRSDYQSRALIKFIQMGYRAVVQEKLLTMAVYPELNPLWTVNTFTKFCNQYRSFLDLDFISSRLLVGGLIDYARDLQCYLEAPRVVLLDNFFLVSDITDE